MVSSGGEPGQPGAAGPGPLTPPAPGPTFRPVSSPARRLARLWRRLSPLPGGRRLFSRILGLMVPYSGSIGARIEVLEPGHCRATLRDRRAVRQHLGSVHAVALVNLGELTSGLALTMALPDGVRGIVTSLQADYLKKARGTLTAEARVAIPVPGAEPLDHQVETVIADGAGEPVCRVRTLWRLARA